MSAWGRERSVDRAVGIRLLYRALCERRFPWGLGFFKPKEPEMHVHVNSASQGTDNIVIELFGDHQAEFRRHLLNQNRAETKVGHYLRCIGNLAEMMKA